MRISIKFLTIITFIFGATVISTAQDLKNSTETPPKITHFPKLKYTDDARRENVSGVVYLKVTFLANGKIGEVSDIVDRNSKELRETGLVNEAIKAAKRIKFKPAIQNGEPVTVSKTVVFTFIIYDR